MCCARRARDKDTQNKHEPTDRKQADKHSERQIDVEKTSTTTAANPATAAVHTETTALLLLSSSSVTPTTTTARAIGTAHEVSIGEWRRRLIRGHSNP